MTIIELPSVSSTNDYIKAHCGEFSDLTLVYTTNQTEGKGRMGRMWLENGKSLAMSLLLKCGNLSPALPLFIGLIARQALSELLDDMEISLKWPNDIIYGGKKLGGVLCESVFRNNERCYICGVGINLTTTKEEFGLANLPDATSLFAESQVIFPAEQVLTAFCEQFKKRIDEFYTDGFVPFVDDYEDYCLTIGRDVVIQNGEDKTIAFAKGISPDGRLIVEDVEKTFMVDAGDVSVRGTDSYS